MTPGEAIGARVGEPAHALLMRRLWPGALAVQVLHAAVALGLGDLIASGTRTSEQLAAATATHEPSLRRLLRALTSLGIFEMNALGEIGHNELSKPLRSQHAASITGLAALLGSELVWQACGGLLGAVRSGTAAFECRFGLPFFEYLSEHQDARDLFHAGLPRRSSIPAEVVAAYDFSGCAYVVDVGGGQGALLSEILGTHSCSATLFDLPAVVADTGASFAARWRERVTVVGGSFFESVPFGGDVYVLSHVLHNWDDGRAATILRCCLAAMHPDSRLLVVESRWLPSADATQAFSDLLMMVLTGGRERSESELGRLLHESGFEVRTTLPTASAWVVEAVPRYGDAQ